MSDKSKPIAVRARLCVGLKIARALHGLKLRRGGLLLLAASALCAGCSRSPPQIVAPTIPDVAGKAAVAEYDKNGDGAIGGAELDASPAIKSALRRLDRDNNGSVTAAEIDARIRAWRETRIGLLQVLPTIYLDGAPLVGAEVRLIPEKFLGTEVQSAVATTNEVGEAPLKSAGDLPAVGVQLGLYRIVVSKKDGDRESIPERYNAKTELGVEISPENAIVERDWKLMLRSK